jgi:hypothetical protein
VYCRRPVDANDDEVAGQTHEAQASIAPAAPASRECPHEPKRRQATTYSTPFTHHCLQGIIARLPRDRISSPILAVQQRNTPSTRSAETAPSAQPNRDNGRRKDNHCPLLRMRHHYKDHTSHLTNRFQPDPRHRLYPRHPLLRPLPQLPHPLGRSNLRPRARAQLDMQQSTIER